LHRRLVVGWRGALTAVLLLSGSSPAGAATISNVSSVTITVTEDPLFILGTILGKVFNDPNANGRQDRGEVGLSGVRLAMEDGTSVVTDPYGRYSIPAVLPGQHLLATDMATLPPGSEMTTERARYIKMTDSLLARANFGIMLPNGVTPPAPVAGTGPTLQTQVVPESALPQPLLVLQMERAGHSRVASPGSPSTSGAPVLGTAPQPLGKPPGFEFQMRTNYPDFIHHWRLLIRDNGQELRRFEGEGPPPQSLAWDGLDAKGLPLERGHRYEAALEVLDAEGHIDYTSLTLMAQEQGRASDAIGGGPSTMEDFLPHPGTTTHAIPMEKAAVVTVRGVTEPSATITVHGQELKPDAMGQFAQQFILPPNTTSVTVESAISRDRTVQTLPVSLSQEHFFLVALAETEIGKLKTGGRLEAVSNEDRNRLEHALYAHGRLAYYLKAKVRGKYLITSSFDMDRERKALFRQLDEDELYPVYGDSSTLSLDATDTQGPLYLLVESDRSYIKWGNYGTGLTGTQLANYNRTLYGGKLHFETMANTPGGEPTMLVTIFGANARQLAAHDELQGTGGVLYYLHQQDVVEGSEKLTLEVRDKLTQQPIERRTLAKGQDYDIDYVQGRLRFYQPVASVADSSTVTTTNLLNGHPVIIVADYEFRPENTVFQEQSFGGRISKTLGDRLSVGTTYVKQEEDGTDYELKGVDSRFQAFPGTTISAEVAHSTAELGRQAVSTDGGLSFTTLTASNNARGNAWNLHLSSVLGNTQLEAGYQSIQAGFSNTATLSHQGIDTLSFRTVTRLTPTTDLVFQHDTQRLTDDGTTSTAVQLGAQTTHTTLGQVVKHIGDLALTGEYRHQTRDRTLNPQETPQEDLLAGRADIPITNGVTAYVSQQMAVRPPSNTQGTIGVKAQLDKDRSIQLEQTAGNLGNATRLLTTDKLANGFSKYSSTTWQRDPLRGSEIIATSGVAKELEGGGRLYMDDEFRRASDGPTFGRIVGVETPLTDRLRMSTSFERGQTESATVDSSHNAWHGALSYANPLKLNTRHELELRFQDGATNERQITTIQEAKYLPTPDVTLFGRLEYTMTRNTLTGLVTARSREVHLGGAYRPTTNDRFNGLAQYTRLEDKGSPGQTDVDNLLGQKQQIISMEGVYDLGHNTELVGKIARRDSTEIVSGAPPLRGTTYQWLTRVNYHLTEAWDLGVEHRILRTRQAEDLRQGMSIELDRTLWKLFQVGVGYHFTKYTEDITHADDFQTNRWFMRLTGKYASWAPDELARREQLKLELMKEEVIWRFADEWLLAHEPQTLERIQQCFEEGEAALLADQPDRAEVRYQEAREIAKDVHERARLGLEIRMAQEDALADWLRQANGAMTTGDETRAAELYDRVIRGVSSLR